jgi:hypothetical protein
MTFEGDIDAITFSRIFNYFKMADVHTSEMDTKLVTVNVRPWNFVC